MKKATIFILLGIISCLLLSSCSSTIHPAHDPAELETTILNGIYIQPNKQNLPSCNKWEKITLGMTIDEVEEMIGYPQRISDKKITHNSPNGIYFFIYDSSDGEPLSIYYKNIDGTLTVQEIVKADMGKLWNFSESTSSTSNDILS